MISEKIKKGTQVLVGLTWYVVDEMTDDGFFGLDQDGGCKQFTFGQVTHIYP